MFELKVDQVQGEEGKIGQEKDDFTHLNCSATKDHSPHLQHTQ
jgi:hypothetical protein